MKSDVSRAVAIICGASAWPNIGFVESTAYANTAKAWREYFGARGGLGIPKGDILLLFDSTDSALEQFEAISDFISSRTRDAELEFGAGLLIFFVYIGHGSFYGKGRAYCLPVRGTRRGLESQSSLHVADIAYLLTEVAPSSSRVIILDCCFAGEAFQHFQTEVKDLADVKIRDVVDRTKSTRRIALLCASSANNAAERDIYHRYTLFGHAIMKILHEGDPVEASDMTLRRVCELARAVLNDMGDGAPMPEVHSPDQTGGDLSSVEIFPNPWHRRSSSEALVEMPKLPLPPRAGVGSSILRKTRSFRSRRAGSHSIRWVTLAVLAALAIASPFAWMGLSKILPAGTPDGYSARTGADSSQTRCPEDSKVAATSTENPALLVEILFSARCDSAWARVTRYEGNPQGNSVTVEIFQRSNPAAPSRQIATAGNVQSATTHIIRRQTPTDRLCATGSISIDGREERITDPVCL